MYLIGFKCASGNVVAPRCCRTSVSLSLSFLSLFSSLSTHTHTNTHILVHLVSGRK
ncbi:hypothetical protein OAV88_03005 [bacterium]|nr:hypothetical protein [bacterium]